MRIFAHDRRKLWVLLPALGLMLFASAAWAADKPGPEPPNEPWIGWVPGVGWAPHTPSATNDASPGIPEGIANILRHTDIPGAPEGSTDGPGISALRSASSFSGAPNRPSMPQ